MEEKKDFSNGNFSNKDVLMEVWRKVDNIEDKIDTAVAALEKRVTVLELETVKRDGPLSDSVSKISGRVYTLENQSKEAKDLKKYGFTRRQQITAIVSAIALVAGNIGSLVVAFVH